ncbi:VapC toxin family PIN domain ribonuclease [Spongiactinospora rosea]|uniref:Ribonuclease VapC n=1 Tax=Spongiactinospora rosea TaxID=2248750 RepID=A0A366LLR8_9ACTN|nr:PIN domain-containing protein [Spongiactinospora rosea]RBQ14767.1 VapC toxin family PIN domain ribonuclease [Spongiactinospora rosea]
MTIIVDTGPLVAALDADDKHHRRCTEFLETVPGPLLVPVAVVVEVCQLVEKYRGSRAEAAFLTSLSNGDPRLVMPSKGDLARAAELVGRYEDLPLGAVDAMVIATAERLGVDAVATLDHRHFSVVRPSHVRAFRLLP